MPHADAPSITARERDVMRLDADALRAWPLPLDEHGDKHARGTVLVIAGSPYTAGAPLLAGIAALRMGAGRLQIATDATVASSLSIAIPEAMVVPLPADARSTGRDAEHLDSALTGCDAALIGPGLLGRDSVRGLLERTIDLLSTDAILVVDAAALAAIAEIDPAVGPALRDRSVLTPNRGELEDLAGGDAQGADVWHLATLVSARTGAVVTSFGAVASPDGSLWMAGEGTPGLGTSGSGDVLAGLVLGAAARCRDAAQAACWATFVHGSAGNRLSRRAGRTSFIARELLDEVPHVLADLERPAGTAHRSPDTTLTQHDEGVPVPCRETSAS